MLGPFKPGKCKHPERVCCIGFKKDGKNFIPDDCPNIDNCELEVGEARYVRN